MNEKKRKYTLPFINDGKPFELNNWTVDKQEATLAETAKFEKDLTEKELDKKYRHILILTGLKEIDSTVTEEDLRGLHPDDTMALFAAVYLQGKRGILVEEKKPFREKGNKNTKTKTTTK